MSTKTILFPPPLRGTTLDESLQKYLLTLQNLLPLITVDTSAGPYSEAPPPAGLNTATGQSNQNSERTYIKISNDANLFTLTGIMGGPFVLTAIRDVIRIKSDGTNWWPVV